MGDTGSLALGGALGAIAVSTQHEIVLGIIGGLFVVEAMSVIIQVLVYKRTGKRVFRMAPIHHHFEQLGWSEPTVVIRFWIIAFVLALAGLSTLKLQMITSPAFRGKTLCGARAWRAPAWRRVEALVASGAEVTAWDEREEARATVAGKAASPIRWRSTLPAMTASSSRRACRSTRHPIAAKARAAGVPVIGDIELFAQARGDLPPHKVVGITGTNGKSTTTALVHHILKTAGVPTTMGGNIGLPILAQDPLPEGGVYVLELSSYQIDLTFSLDCDVAVLLNVTPGPSRPLRRASRPMPRPRRGCSRCSRPASAVIARETSRLATNMRSVGSRTTTGLRDRCGRNADQSRWPALQGPHNAANAAAAIAVCKALGLDDEDNRARACAPIPACRTGWSGWPSATASCSSTTARRPTRTRTAPALAAFPHVHWIVGGLAKTEGSGALRGPARPCPRRLHDRRGGADVRAAARGPGAGDAMRKCWRRR